jgi:putative SOS response-associated peptidase YedK
MCGRYVSVQSTGELLAEFEALDSEDRGGLSDDERAQLGCDYNVAPTKPIRVIVNRRLRGENGESRGDPVRQLRVVRWGLVPSWSKDAKGAARMINARAESVPTKPAFRNAFAKRRCLVPADGWYEWRKAEGSTAKQPFFMTPLDGHGLALAGLYEFWGPPGQTMTTCTIITTEAVGALGEIHDRMPLVLPRVSWSRWLDAAAPGPEELLAPWDEAAGEHIELRPVSTEVNAVAHQGPELLARVDEAPPAQVLF